MRSNYKITGSLLVILLIIVAASNTTLTSQEQQRQSASESGQRKSSLEEQEQHRNESENNFPVANYAEPDAVDPDKRARRKEKNKRYDKSSFVSKNPNAKDTEVAVYYEGGGDVPALPTSLSEVVVVAEVLEAQAHLSNDKTNVYSEFTARISEVLKNKGSASLAPGKSITVERVGGFVLYPNGHKLLYRVVGQGMPSVGRRYLLFLNAIKESQDYRILTGYELGLSGASPLDYFKQFYMYKGHDEDALLKAVFDAVHSY